MIGWVIRRATPFEQQTPCDGPCAAQGRQVTYAIQFGRISGWRSETPLLLCTECLTKLGHAIGKHAPYGGDGVRCPICQGVMRRTGGRTEQGMPLDLYQCDGCGAMTSTVADSAVKEMIRQWDEEEDT